MTSSNTKTIALCISLFLASALVTLTLNSPNRPAWPSNPSLLRHHNSISGPHHQSPIGAGANVAFATFLAEIPHPDAKQSDEESEAIDDEDDGYFLGARVLAYMLLHSKTAGTNGTIPFLVVCTRDVSKRKRKRLRKDGAEVVLVEKLDSAWVAPAVTPWANVMTKLRLFQLTKYTKICFIDADTLVTGRLDGVFWDEATLSQPTLTNSAAIREDESALPRTYMLATHAEFYGYDHPYPPEQEGTYLNCGFFVFTPSPVLFDYYMSLLKLPGRFDTGFPEQNLLNYAHRRDGNMPWKPLWYGWNVNWSTANDWRSGARSFHAKYWDGDLSHDPALKQIWREQRAEMRGFWAGREEVGW